MKSFKELRDEVLHSETKTIAVACAHDEDVVKSLELARNMKIANSILIGDAEKINEIFEKLNINKENYQIINEKNMVEACNIAVNLVSSRKADVLMKGLVDTSIILKAVLNKEIGLRTGKPLSHIAVFEIEGYDRFIYITDAAMHITPDIEAKKAIIENAVSVAHSIGNSCPKVAAICAKEKVDPKMEATVDAQKLQQMNEEGIIKGCIVGGPLALDNAISKEAAQQKGIENKVAGEADILLMPYIEVGNALYKSLVYFSNAENAGIVMGASAPVVLTSRADSETAKLNSIALAMLCAN